MITQNHTDFKTSFSNVASLSEALSLNDIMPQEYHFLPFDRLYKMNTEQIEIKSSGKYSVCKENSRYDHQFYCSFIMPFFRLIKKDTNNHIVLRHLNRIIELYKIEMPEFLVNFKTLNNNALNKKVKTFKYTYKEGYSCAFKRNMNMKNFFE